MAGQKFLVKYVDGRQHEVKLTPRVEVDVERHFKMGLSEFQNNIHAEYLYYMAWCGLHHQKVEHCAFEEFLDLIEDIDPVEQKPQDVEADPTMKGLPSGDSSS